MDEKSHSSFSRSHAARSGFGTVENSRLSNAFNSQDTNTHGVRSYIPHDEKALSSLSRDDLLALVREIEAKLTPPPNDWHSLFYALLMIELHDKPSVRVEREILLGAQPPRADFLVLEENELVVLRLSIFRIFRQRNIIEFKSPDDSLNMSTLWKTIGYAGFYIVSVKCHVPFIESPLPL